MVLKKYKILLLFWLLSQQVQGQAILSEIELTDVQRMQQITDTAADKARSYFIRSSFRYQEKLNTPDDNWYKLPKIYPIHIGYSLHNNTHMPFTENDGSMIPNIGFQQRATGGVFVRWYWFTLQIQPEWVMAENKLPAPFTRDPFDNNFLSRYFHYIVNKTDLFERIGTERENQWWKGQSRISANLPQNISISLSSENLWWGPGRRNSLVLTNTAPGFLHLRAESRKPIKTPIGNVEFQLMQGHLNRTRYESPDYEMMRNFWAGGILKKYNAKRGIWGYVFSWNPKWFKGLHLGTAGTEYFYWGALPIEKTDLLMPSENKPSRSRLGSFYVRYAMPKEQAEVYLEYGRANRFVSPVNIWSDTIPTAYTLGARKLFPLGARKKSHFELSLELTHLQLPDARLIYNTDGIFGIPRTMSWYTHPYILQGYTSDAQALGASIGPGSNSERLDLGWVKGYKRISIFGERVARNYDFFYYNYLGVLGLGSSDKNWVDLHYGGQIRWDFGPVIMAGSWSQTRTLNYMWTKLDGGFNEPSPRSDRWNNRVQFSLFYQMKSK